MALNTPQFGIPTSLVFTPRDYSQQMAANQASDTQGLQNLFKFGTQVYDAIKNRQIANEMDKENPDYKKIDSLAAQRINNPDTSFSNWRWKQGAEQTKQMHDETLAQQAAQREADLARVQAEKDINDQKNRQSVMNEISSVLPTMSISIDTTPDQRQQYLNTLAGLKTKALNANVPLEMITRKEAELGGELPYNQLQNAYTDFDNLNDLFDKTKDQGGFAKNIAEYKNAIFDIWNSHPEFQSNPAFRRAYIKALNAHNSVKKNPGTKPSKRK